MAGLEQEKQLKSKKVKGKIKNKGKEKGITMEMSRGSCVLGRSKCLATKINEPLKVRGDRSLIFRCSDRDWAGKG